MDILNIKSPQDIKALGKRELMELSAEIRRFIIEKVSKTGGHLASNLGTVELTIALHYVFDSPKDAIIFDVGHQCYTHKILTGRAKEFDTLRQYKGLSGFPKPAESKHDIYITGHSSTSISIALGMAQARKLQGIDGYVIALIGDGALTAGIAFEALNNAGHIDGNIIIVLNDNEMSISPNVGAISKYLNQIRYMPIYKTIKHDIEKVIVHLPDKIKKKAIRLAKTIERRAKALVTPGLLFEEFGLYYMGPYDGHDIDTLIRVFERAKKMDVPRIIHVRTVKGKGYEEAEKKPSKYHGVSGKVKIDLIKGETFTEVFSKYIVELASKNKRIVAITAAMPDGTGLYRFRDSFPDRFYDVGIAEQHAITFAGGLAREGLRPVVAIYSTFMQRAVDQVIHDIATMNLPIVFVLDRAGVVPHDGITHQGIFDIAIFSSVPNIEIINVSSKEEVILALNYAFSQSKPVFVRLAKDIAPLPPFKHGPMKTGYGEVVYKGKDMAIVSSGVILNTCISIANKLQKDGYDVGLVNMRFVKPISKKFAKKLFENYKVLFVVEENVYHGGVADRLGKLASLLGVEVDIVSICIDDIFIAEGSRNELLHSVGLSYKKIYNRIIKYIKLRFDKK